MSETWFISDTHFGHRNIINFTDKEGKRIRPFSSIEEHDETIVDNYNKLVNDGDRVYFMGDVVIAKRNLEILRRMKGRKKLIKGNHDIFKLKDYAVYFDDIVAYRIYPEQNLIVSHIPVHTSNLENRFKWNLHGHTHINLLPDQRYINACLEHTDFKPINFHQIKAIMEERENALATT